MKEDRRTRIDSDPAPATGGHWADGLTRHCHIDSHFGGFREIYRQSPRRVTAMPAGTRVAAEYADGRLRFTATLRGAHAVYCSEM